MKETEDELQRQVHAKACLGLKPWHALQHPSGQSVNQASSGSDKEGQENFLIFKKNSLLKPFHHPSLIEAGCDEAGRGSFAGPVFAAAVILPATFRHPLLNDSKQLKASERDIMRVVIEKEALAYAVAMVGVEEIDTINILRASIKAMHLAVEQLAVTPSSLLIDGNYFIPYKEIPHRCFIKGDGTYASIAAASILAKTYRDEYMLQLHEEFPDYRWHSNKGYGTKAHRDVILRMGICKHHRKSFRLFPGEQSNSS